MRAFALLLMTLLVVQAPVASVDRLLHALGQGHTANAFAGLLLASAEGDHDRHHDHDGAHGAAEGPGLADGGDIEPGAFGPHHHHHDTQPIYALAAATGMASAWSSTHVPFGIEDDLRYGIGARPQERPPKQVLAIVA